MSIAFPELEHHAQAHHLSGVVQVERREEIIVEFACGHSDRANERVKNLQTRFAVASGTTPLTALTIMSLVESGAFNLNTTLRSVVQDDLPHVDEAVTIDYLLTHRSGVGDYLDESPPDNLLPAAAPQ